MWVFSSQELSVIFVGVFRLYNPKKSIKTSLIFYEWQVIIYKIYIENFYTEKFIFGTTFIALVLNDSEIIEFFKVNKKWWNIYKEKSLSFIFEKPHRISDETKFFILILP